MGNHCCIPIANNIVEVPALEKRQRRHRRRRHRHRDPQNSRSTRRKRRRDRKRRHVEIRPINDSKGAEVLVKELIEDNTENDNNNTSDERHSIVSRESDTVKDEEWSSGVEEKDDPIKKDKILPLPTFLMEREIQYSTGLEAAIERPGRSTWNLLRLETDGQVDGVNPETEGGDILEGEGGEGGEEGGKEGN